MSTYHQPDRGMLDVLHDVTERYHDRLVDAGVRVAILQARAVVDKNGIRKGPAIRHGGYACLATIRIVPTRQRVAGLADAEILVDGDRWPDLSAEERRALIDHELTHIEVKEDDDGVLLELDGSPEDVEAAEGEGAEQAVASVRAARHEQLAADIASSSIAVLQRKADSATIEVVRRAIELEGGRPKPRRGAMQALEARLAELLEEADAEATANSEADTGERSNNDPEAALVTCEKCGKEHHPTWGPECLRCKLEAGPGRRPGINPAQVIKLFDDEAGARG